ncbi:MAG TPA: GAF domain-containing protein [Planctomycetota bacterium]|nr:GAF domain-containing protein [Planctomycetota bacterium]
MSDNLASSREAWIRALVSRITLARGYKSALGGVLKRLCRAGGWSYAEAWIPTHDGTGLKMGPVFARSRSDEVGRFRQRGRELGFRPGQGLVGQVFLSGMPRWVETLGGGENELPRRQALARDAGFESAAAFPVLLNDGPTAVLVFYGDEARERDPALVDKTGVALAAVGPALEQKRVEMSVRAQARQHEVVANIGLRALDRSTDIPSLLGEAAALAARTLDADAAAVLELQKDGRLTVRASAGWPKEALESTIAEPYFAHVLAAEKPVAVPSFRGNGNGFPPPSLFVLLGARSAATAVVPGRARPLGLLCVVAREPRRFVEDAFLRALAQVLGVAMERDRAERDLEHERARLAAELEASHEELRQADRLRAIATLASGITHDMNNVMLPALCRLDAIEAAGLPAAAAREIEGVRGAFDKLRKLARGLQLVATNPEDGVSFPASTRLEPWWREIGGLLALALRRDVQLTAAFPDGLPPVAAAPPQLTHAVLGLVHVLGETFEGPGRILVRAEPDGARFVRLSVADASPDPHRRALEPLEKRTAGARSFAVAAGGSLDVGPNEVALRLPVAPAAAEPRFLPESLPRRAEIQLKDARAAAFVTSLLASAGFEITPRDKSVLAVWDGSEDPAAVRRYLSENTSRRVLLLGAPRSPAPRGASIVNEPGNLEAVRRTLGTMVEELLEITDDSIRTDAGSLRR